LGGGYVPGYGFLIPLIRAAGGVDVRLSPRLGLRLEMREEFPWMLTFRTGLVFQ
jgi:hypothetical protein